MGRELSSAELCELVSPYGDLHQVLPSELVGFCTQHGLVKLCDQTGLPKARHIDELRRLLDPLSRLRQLNGWQPLHKLRFLQKIDLHHMKPIAERSIEPVLGDEKHFVLHICSSKEDMKNIFNYEELAKYLNCKGVGHSRTPTSTHYRGWRQVNLSISRARRLLLQMSASRQPVPSLEL
ncbi:hypothetical protein AB1Y20_003359 [Prymnesium parvum]|uniref:Uncharacterized protein n=1 Tax=Prymnesium parvum TaxID=97485 RepID=A0AB34JD33_PRYPA